LTPEDTALFGKIVKDRSGLALTTEKAYLLESRLLPVARKWNIEKLEELASAVRRKPEEALLDDITEAMTTNETFFFRDTRPFDLFRDEILPPLLESRASLKTLRIWCAAASTGQEPYTLGIVLKELESKLAGWKIDILATDISPSVLERAKGGLYSQFEVQRGLPIQLLLKYFQKKDEMWEISEPLRKMIRFKEFNLLDAFTPLGGRFDIVFCRNVLIYFDRDTKAVVLEKISRLLPPDGKLFLGGAETVMGISEKFKPVQGQRGVYAPT
jgi:chemotaxis protein methyltransferase CheR